MRITNVATVGSTGGHGFFSVLTMLGALLLLWGPTIVAAAAEMLTFPLTRTNATSVVNQYAIEMQLGTIGYARSVYFLPVLYTSTFYDAKNGGPKPLYVPSAELCLNQKEQEEWNKFLRPQQGELVNTTASYMVEWVASVNTKLVNLSLRNGGGAEGKNITVIGMGISNNGTFEWQAAKTKREQKIGDDVEVSLMLWTENPPQRSYSPTFTMREFSDAQGIKQLASRQKYTPPGSNAYAQCMTYLLDNGGVYNYTEDKEFKVEINSDDVGTFDDAVSGWEVKVTNTGTTTVTYQAQEIGGDILNNITVAEMGVNLMTADTQGMGIVALSEIQRMRNKGAWMSGDHVVAIYLGSGDVAGHVVMGGHDRALIDQAHGSAVFEKPKLMDGQFEVQLVDITYVPDGLEGRSLEARSTEGDIAISMNRTQLRLSFNSPTICLPDVILKDLLPHIGAPVYSKELNGYLYEASAKTDYSLRFTLANSTSGNFVNITIPASSLLYRETTNDNPLTDDLIESGREFLLLAPLDASNGGIGYLGRAFLQHLYMVDDSYLNKFFISAINTTAIKEGSSSVMTGSSGLMAPVGVNSVPQESTTPDSDMGHNSISPVVGPVLGGVIGAIALLWLIFLFFYLRKRRARSQLSSQAGDDVADDGEKALEQGMAAMLGPRGERGGRDVCFHPRRESRQFDEIAKEVDIPPLAILRGGRQPVSPISLEPDSTGRIMPFPFTISRNSTHSPRTSSSDKPPPPPVKDEQYFRTVALAHKRFSQPFMKGPHSPLVPSNRKRQSAPVTALETGPYSRYLHDTETTEGIQSPTPIPTYQQLLAYHQARRQRDSYIDSESSNGNENDATTSNTSSTETATLGKVISKGQVAKIRQLSSTPPHVALANMLERRASVGRVIVPGEVVIVPPSRRTSRSSRELLQSSRKSISRSASSHSAEGTTEGAVVGHRRGKSAPSGLGFSLSAPPLPPPRAKDDIFVGGLRVMGVRSGGKMRRVPVPSAPPPRPIEEDEHPTSFLEDATEDGMSSCSSTVLPKGARLVKRSDSESSGEKGPSPVSPLSKKGEGADYFSGEQERDSIVSPVSPLTPPPFEREFP